MYRNVSKPNVHPLYLPFSNRSLVAHFTHTTISSNTQILLWYLTWPVTFTSPVDLHFVVTDDI